MRGRLLVDRVTACTEVATMRRNRDEHYYARAQPPPQPFRRRIPSSLSWCGATCLKPSRASSPGRCVSCRTTPAQAQPRKLPSRKSQEEREKWRAHDVELEALALGGVWQLAGREGLGLEDARLRRHRQQEVVQLRNHLSHIRKHFRQQTTIRAEAS